MHSIDNTLQVAVWPALYPFSGQPPVRKPVVAGQKLSEVVKFALKERPALLKYAVVHLNGERIPADKWRSLRVKPGVNIDIRCVPQGGGGKNPLATILSIGLMAVAPMIGGAIAGSLGLAGQGLWLGSTFFSAGTIIGGAVSIAGRLLISALLPPAKPRTASNGNEKVTQFISGARNSLLPWNAVPQVLGKMRMVPPYAAKPYTETVGNDQYVRMLFCLGFGPLTMSDLKIGETAISEFNDVEWEFIPSFDGVTPIALYSNSVMQDEYNVLLQEADGWVLRTTDTDADEISLDITFPQGLTRFNGEGKRVEVEVQLEVQYSLSGADDWSAGIESFKPILAKTSDAMAAPKGSLGMYGRKLRVFRVVMDKSSGKLSVVAGAITTVGLQDEDIPPVPADRLPIAQVWRYSDDPDNIPSDRIIDERGSAFTDGTFEAADDFLPGTSLTQDRISVAAGGLKFPGIYVRAKQAGALRRAVTFKTPVRGQYDIRIRRLSEDTDTDRIFDKAYLTAVRAIRYSLPVRRAGVALLAMRIKATDQLNGAPDQINAVVQSIVPDWDEVDGVWIERPTSNPASLYRYVLQGAANYRPVTDEWLKLDQIQEWWEWCAQNSFEYNAIIDSPVSVQDMLREIAAAGRAAPHTPDLKWGVIREKPDAVPVQMFTPANMWDFSGTLNYPEVPHALRVRFLNAEKGYAQDEVIVYSDGYDKTTAQKYESIEAVGVTSAAQAWRFGRYYLANMILRPETYTFSADIDALDCTRGDVVTLQRDTILVGLGSALIKSVSLNGDGNITGFSLDDAFVMVSGKNYAVRVRQANGTQRYLPVVRVVGESTSLTLSNPLVVVDPDDAPAAGDLVSFGEAGKDTIDVVIKSISLDTDFRAELTCVDYAPAIQTADTGTIPPHQSVITIPPELQRPPQPQLVSFQADEETLIKNPDGSFTSTAVLTLAPVGWPLPLTPSLKIKGAGETDFFDPVYTVNGNRLTIFGLEAGDYYDFKIIYTNQQGQSSNPLNLSGLLVTGDENPPSDVTGFSINILNSTAFLSWNEVSDVDLDFYRIKFNAAITGATWENSIDLFERISGGQTSIGVPAQAGTYLIKAYDYGGRESLTADEFVCDIGGILGFNAVADLVESPTFVGAKEDVVVVTGTLQLTTGVTEGIYYFDNDIDLGAVYTSLVTASIGVTGVTRDDNVDLWTNVDIIPNWDGSADTSKWRIEVQIRTTNDDPSGTPTWGAWQKLIVSQYTARAYQFRVLLFSDDTNTTPSISDLTITVDMPDRVDGARGVESEASDTPSTRVDFFPPFREVPALAIITYNMATGDYYEILANDEAGFNIAFFNASGTRVNRTFDWIAKGYGYEL